MRSIHKRLPRGDRLLVENAGWILQERDRLTENRICDVNYAEIRRDPLVAVRRIYAHFGWSLSQKVEQRCAERWQASQRKDNKLHRYDLAQFDVHEAESAARFAAYCDRFGLAVAGNVHLAFERKSWLRGRDNSGVRFSRYAGLRLAAVL